MTESISELQQARDALKQNIHDVDENIKKLTGRDPEQGGRLSTPRRIQLKRNSYGTPGSTQPPTKRTPVERRRWGNSALSSRQNLDSGGEEEEKQKPTVPSSVVATGKPIESLQRPVREDTQTRKRNQRMFGLLLGTLKQFKQESKFKSEQECKQEEKLQKVEEQVEKDKEDALRERKELFQSRRDKQKELKKVEFKLEMAELVVDLQSHYQHMKDYIQLKSTPRLFYKPKQHNKKTSKLLEDSRTSLKESLEQRLKEIEMCTEEDLFQLSRSRAQRASRGHGKTAKDPIVIDAVASARDLFAEDAEIDDREREADEMKEQAKSEKADMPALSDDVVITQERKVEEVFEEGVITVENGCNEVGEVTERVVVNGEDARAEIDEKLESEPISVQDNTDSRRVVPNSNSYSVVDERVVELSSSTAALLEEQEKEEVDLDDEIHKQLENLDGDMAV